MRICRKAGPVGSAFYVSGPRACTIPPRPRIGDRFCDTTSDVERIAVCPTDWRIPTTIAPSAWPLRERATQHVVQNSLALSVLERSHSFGGAAARPATNATAARRAPPPVDTRTDTTPLRPQPSTKHARASQQRNSSLTVRVPRCPHQRSFRSSKPCLGRASRHVVSDCERARRATHSRRDAPVTAHIGPSANRRQLALNAASEALLDSLTDVENDRETLGFSPRGTDPCPSHC